MSSVWIRMRAELRGRWRAWFGLALLLGVFAGAIIAAAAGARRTDSAYPRFLKSQNAYDIAVPLGFFDPCCAELTYDQVKGLPLIREIYPMTGFFEGPTLLLTSSDPRMWRTVNAYKVLEGRLPDLRRENEVIVPFELARQRRWRVGSAIAFPRPDGGTSPFSLRVVGIGAAPGDFPPTFGAGTGGVVGTPAFNRRYSPFVRSGENGFQMAIVRLERGDADLDAFHRELNRLTGGKVLAFTLDQRDSSRNIDRAFNLQAAALWLVAGMATLAALFVFTQTMAREMFLESTEYPTLRSLGMTQADLFRLGMARSVTIAGIAAVVATVVAVALSPLFPTGLPRIAEPDPGLAFDATAIGVGAGAIIVLVSFLALIPARRTARVGGTALGVAEMGSGHPSAAVESMSRAGFPPSAVAGVRLALEPGHGRTAVPVRTTIFGITVGIAALATAISFSASLTYLLGNPTLYGQNWDATFASGQLRSGSVEQLILPTLRSDRRIEAMGLGTVGLPLEIGPLRVGGIVINNMEGRVTPVARTGREPRTDLEILLGERTLETLKKRVGDSVPVAVQGATQAPMRIVGTGIIPPVGPTARFGEGALIRYGSLKRLCQCDVPPEDTVIVRFAPGTPVRETIAEIRRDLRAKLREQGIDITRPERPTDLLNFGRVKSLPLILAGLLGALAAAVLAHALVTVIRRRGRDLAILKTLGFLRRQVRGAVAWQATSVAAIALVLGLPLGIGLARWLWTVFANELGVIPAPRVPVTVMLLVIPAGLLFANLIAARPAHTAARTRPALVLRTE